jgi:crotonobetainyl-CoA:carnitine CoA-transferase CaiB-like acyl-CoA transferase
MGPLDGVKVVDATRLLPGGFCTMLLSDLGAEVVKVEQPGLGDYMRLTPPVGDGPSPVHEMVNRNKLSIGIDLKKEDGRNVLRKLIAQSDTFVEGFRPGVNERLGFTFPQVKKVNPRIIYCSISAFGHASSMSSMPGHDINFQAMSGALGSSEATQVPLLQLGDMCAGMYAAIGVLSALARTQKAGAVYIDVPIVQSLASWLVIPVSAYLVTKLNPVRGHSLVFGSEAYYNIYKTSDKKYIAVAAIEDEFWHNLLEALGLLELERLRNGSSKERSYLKKKLKEKFASGTRDEWASSLMHKNTCVTPILNIGEVLDSEWARSSKLLTKAGGQAVLNTPISFHPEITGKKRRAPTLGQHTNRIMKSLGYTGSEVRKLKRMGAVQ